MLFDRHQPDIWGLTKSMLQNQNILLNKIIPCLVQQHVGLVGIVQSGTPKLAQTKTRNRKSKTRNRVLCGHPRGTSQEAAYLFILSSGITTQLTY